MQVSYGRLQAYAGMGFLSFAMIVLGSPIGNTGTWFGSMVMIGLGLWIELSDYYDEDEDENDPPESLALGTQRRTMSAFVILPAPERVERMARSSCCAVCSGLALASLKKLLSTSMIPWRMLVGTAIPSAMLGSRLSCCSAWRKS